MPRSATNRSVSPVSSTAAGVISQTALAQGVAATPIDQYVIWDGGSYDARAGSRCSQVLGLINEIGTPVPLRELVLRAARMSGFRPEDVRGAVRAHQAARGACYLLVRKTAAGEYVSAAEIPFPATRPGPIRAGEVIMSRPARPLPVRAVSS